MINLYTKGTITISKEYNVKVDPVSVLQDIKREYCHVPEDAYTQDGKIICNREDYHGHPFEEEIEVPNISETQKRIIQLTNELIKLIKSEEHDSVESILKDL